jgi:hypothetical protein
MSEKIKLDIDFYKSPFNSKPNSTLTTYSKKVRVEQSKQVQSQDYDSQSEAISRIGNQIIGYEKY